MLDSIELAELDKLADMRLAQPYRVAYRDDNANFDRMARLSKSCVQQIMEQTQLIERLKTLIDEYAAGRIIC